MTWITEKELEREIKTTKETNFVGIKTRKFHNGGEKIRNVNTHNISSIKRVTMRFLEVSRSSLAKQRQRNV